MLKNKIIIFFIVWALAGTITEQQCSSTPKAPKTISTSPEEMRDFFLRHQSKDPWKIFGLKENASREDIVYESEKMINQLKHGSEHTSYTWKKILLELAVMAERIRDDLLARADASKTSTAPTVKTATSQKPTEVMREMSIAKWREAILECQHNPWLVFKLEKSASKEQADAAFNTIKNHIDAFCKNCPESSRDALELLDMFKRVRDDLVARIDAAKTNKTAENRALMPERVDPTVFYTTVVAAYKAKDPWSIFGVTQSTDSAVVHEVFERFTAWYAPEIIDSNSKSSAADKKIARPLYDLLKKSRDNILNKEEDIKELAAVKTAQRIDPIDLAPILKLSPYNLCEFIGTVEKSEPWLVFGIAQDANVATIETAFQRVATTFNTYTAMNAASSTLYDKLAAPYVYEKLIELRRKMFEAAREREAKEHSQEQQKSSLPAHTTSSDIIGSTKLL